eukprot:XP_022283518.1 uncharacterized protein LOC102151706 isoform X1 [Canis lupus familiaris]
MRDTQRGRDTGRGRSRLLWDSILGPRDHVLSQSQMLTYRATQVPRVCLGISACMHRCPFNLCPGVCLLVRPHGCMPAHLCRYPWTWLHALLLALRRASLSARLSSPGPLSGCPWMSYLLSLPRTCISECFWGCAHRLVHFWGCTSTCEGVGIYLRLQAWLHQEPAQAAVAVTDEPRKPASASGGGLPTFLSHVDSAPEPQRLPAFLTRAVASPAARESSPQRQREPGSPPPSPRGAPPSPPTCWRVAFPPAGTAAGLDFRARVPLLSGLCLDGPSAISGTFLGFDWGLLRSCPGETALPRSLAQSRATSLGCGSLHGPAAVQGRGSGSGVGWGASLSAPGSWALDQDCGGWIIPGPPLFSCHHHMPPPPLAISSLP